MARVRSLSTPTRHVPRWSDVAPLIAAQKPELSPTGRRLANALVIDDLRTIARRRCPRSVFDYVDGAASDEISLRRARQLYADLQFNPSVLHDVSDVDTDDFRARVAVGATVRVRAHGVHPADAPRGRMRRRPRCATARDSVCAVDDGDDVHRGCRRSRAEGAQVVPALRLARPRGRRRPHRAGRPQAGYEALILTVDVPVAGPRLRDARHGFSIPPKLKLEDDSRTRSSIRRGGSTC